MGYREYRFFVTSRAIRQSFSRVTSSLVKIIAESPHSWQKISIHGNPYLILFLRAILCPDRAHKPAKTIIDCHSSICEVTWKRVTGIVMSYSSIVRARANWCNGDLHWWITTVHIGFSGGWKLSWQDLFVQIELGVDISRHPVFTA